MMKAPRFLMPALLLAMLAGCAATPGNADNVSAVDDTEYTIGSNIPHHSLGRATVMTDSAQQELATQILRGNPARLNK
ncbi:hypothetical protein [Chromobacterium sp. CV08]|uniref:hypothetical protein n=1 Tax=Chromobacterium sp. CV08 TaxID=3133274 RepID=UPI003DA7AA51